MAETTNIQARIQQAVFTVAELTTANPLLLKDEIVYERETMKSKMGNGADRWSALPYMETGGGAGDDCVKFTAQSLTEAQKTQVCQNIDAVEKVEGKGLSTQDFTLAEKLLVASINSKMVKLTATQVTTTSLTVDGGKAYYRNSMLNVSGVGAFSDTQDSSIITTQGNTSVVFSSQFKVMKDMSSIVGTASQYKVYAIQRVPITASTYIYLVNCAIYG